MLERNQHVENRCFRKFDFLKFKKFKVCFDIFFFMLGAAFMFIYRLMTRHCFLAAGRHLSYFRVECFFFFTGIINFKKRYFILSHAKAIHRIHAETHRRNQDDDNEKTCGYIF